MGGKSPKEKNTMSGFPGFDNVGGAVSQFGGMNAFTSAPTATSAAMSAAPAAASGGGGLFAALAAPGVGTALTVGASVLGGIFGARQSRRQAEQQRFQAELASQDRKRQIAAQQAAAATQNLGAAVRGAGAQEVGAQQVLQGSLRRFF
jgi:hypothetical protein